MAGALVWASIPASIGGATASGPASIADASTGVLVSATASALVLASASGTVATSAVATSAVATSTNEEASLLAETSVVPASGGTLVSGAFASVPAVPSLVPGVAPSRPGTPAASTLASCPSSVVVPDE